MIVSSFVLKGDISEEKSKRLVQNIMKAIEVKPAHKSITYRYPLAGKGGEGYTHIQPITESFIAFDAWKDFKGAYLIICSCKLFWLVDVIKVIKKSGYKLVENNNQSLSLKDTDDTGLL